MVAKHAENMFTELCRHLCRTEMKVMHHIREVHIHEWKSITVARESPIQGDRSGNERNGK